MEAVEATATTEIMPPVAPWQALPEGQYAIVELMGHTTLVGRVTEIERFGTKMMGIEPLLHRACAAISMRHCPSLRRDIADGTLMVRQVTRYRVQFAVMGPQFISHYVPGYVAKPTDRIVGAAKVELLRWVDRDADWLEAI